MPRKANGTALKTVADLLERLGDVPAHRIRLDPPPGTATEKDLIRLNDLKAGLYELVDGVLVAKVMSFPESALGVDIVYLLQTFLNQHDVGFLAGINGPMRLRPGLVCMPDVSFVSWDQLPKRERPTDAIAGLAPALAVEVLSEGNTKREMELKVRDYCVSGVRQVWLVDPVARTIEVFSAPD